MASSKRIYREWRIWFVAGYLVTFSLYKVGHRHYPWNGDGLAPIVRNFATEQAALWSPISAFVMDVAETPDGCKIIEINTINHSGLYSCDTASLILSLEEHGSTA